jgi:hypothetical protein
MYYCKFCGRRIRNAHDREGTLIGFCETCGGYTPVAEIPIYSIDYDPVEEVFSLDDKDTQTMIVITKKQLEALMSFYKELFK